MSLCLATTIFVSISFNVSTVYIHKLCFYLIYLPCGHMCMVAGGGQRLSDGGWFCPPTRDRAQIRLVIECCNPLSHFAGPRHDLACVASVTGLSLWNGRCVYHHGRLQDKRGRGPKYSLALYETKHHLTVLCNASISSYIYWCR